MKYMLKKCSIFDVTILCGKFKSIIFTKLQKESKIGKKKTQLPTRVL